MTYEELRKLAEENPAVDALIRDRVETLRNAISATPGATLGVTIKVRRGFGETDDDLRRRLSSALASRREVAPKAEGVCDCPPGVPVLMTNPDHCPACGKQRENVEDELARQLGRGDHG